MFGLPSDTVRRKFRTKVVQNNAINPVYDEDPFVFHRVSQWLLIMFFYTNCRSVVVSYRADTVLPSCSDVPLFH